MLKQRIITAVVLLVLLSAAMLASASWPLLFIFLLASSLACWEWLRLSLPAKQGFLAPPLALSLAVLLAYLSLSLLQTPQASTAAVIWRGIHVYLVPLIALAWIFGAFVLVLQGRADKIRQSFPLSVMGVLAPLVAWAALVQMYLQRGVFYVLSVLVLIWVADIAAYFAGRAWGKRKLAPRVSPGKTWAGAFGGVAGASLWVMASTYWPDSFGSDLVARWSWPGALLLAALLAAVSIMGDLFESLLKRRAGVKDSSQLLPGHGGVYDRIDALLPVAPLALLLGSTPVHPWFFA